MGVEASCSGGTGWRTGTRYPPVTASVREARRFVETELAALGRPDLSDDAGLVLSELAANAVLHARTPFEVVVSSADHRCVRVDVLDGSSSLPVLATALQTSTTGRGMVLVAALASRWGSERLEDGKTVWFEVGGDDEHADPDDPSAEDLLAMWADLDAVVTVVVPDLPVAALLAAKEHLDDLVRELQIVMHDPVFVARAEHEAPEEVVLARRLDAAVQAFEPARVQVRTQVVRAAREGRERVTLELVLNPGAGADARRFLEAVEDAHRLSLTGVLLTRGDELGRHAAVRRLYLEEVVRQLG
ncbi:ATP-binding protein [Streptomyces sp. NP160]|uniref:ATP-binding protein n=1 Tax=Streptomyces sp. NP160 TaxID=2586637 RepID=UPI001118B1D1|nr:ATP-binding protein [Streptomyces sp. NP160]TNM59793.1 ATP-binding protein [Streptomyces sp. NP160]